MRSLPFYSHSRSHAHLFLLALVIFFFSSCVSAKTGATSFCKCICGSESQIIALNPPDAHAAALRARSSSQSLLSLRSIFDANAFPLPRLRGRADDEDKDEKEGEDKDDGGKEEEDDSRKRQKTCADCNRAFCLTYNLPKCKTLPEEEVYTQCFQRDSSKDQAVVLLFIAATVGLLGWAIVRPWAGKLMQNARTRNSYAPVQGEVNH